MNEEFTRELGTRLEELLPASFEGGILLPEQYYDLNGRSAHSDGEYRLAFAVLADAVSCYLKYRGRNGRKTRMLFEEVRYWMNSPSRQGIYSYLNLCEILNIDGKELLRALERNSTRSDQTLREIRLSQWLGKPQSGLCPSRRPLRVAEKRKVATA